MYCEMRRKYPKYEGVRLTQNSHAILQVLSSFHRTNLSAEVRRLVVEEWDRVSLENIDSETKKLILAKVAELVKAGKLSLSDLIDKE